MGFDHGYALLIGVNDNSVPSLVLPIVAKDVAKLSSVLLHPDRCGYRSENVTIVTGSKATRAGILDGLTWLEGKLEADQADDQTAIVYFSGHAHRDPMTGEGYLLPYDVTRPFRRGGMKAKDFSDAITQVKAKRLLVVLDCCHAASLNVKGNTSETELAPTSVDIDGFATDTRAILNSSKDVENSYVRSDAEMSVFTYHFVEALLGHAATLGSPIVTVSQVMAHVEHAVPGTAKKMFNQPQNPWFRYNGAAFPLAQVLGGKGITKGEAAPDPLSPIVVARLEIDELKGRAENVTIKVMTNGTVLAETNVGTVEQGAELVNVKIDRLG